MALYLVSRDYENDNAGQWDTYRAHVIRADSPEKAREMAARRAADEGPEIWDNAKVEELDGEGRNEIVLSDFMAG